LRRSIEIVVAAGALTLGLCLLSSCRQSEFTSDQPDAIQMCDEGTADLQAFRFQEAVNKLGHCLKLDPTLAEAAISRALAYANLQDTKNARRELAHADSLTAAIVNDRRRMLAQLRLSRYATSRYHALGDSLRDRMGRQEPDNFFVLETLAEHAEATGDAEGAVQIWQRVLAINPNHAAAYNKLGYLELGRGAYDTALEYLQKYIFLAPDLANPHDSYGEALLTMGRYEEAEAEFRAALRIQQDFYPALIKLGRSYLFRGKVAKGSAILDQVRHQIAGSELEHRVDLQILITYLASGEWDPLATTWREFVVHYPKDSLTPLMRSMMLVKQGQATRAAAVMDSTLAARRASRRYNNHQGARAETEVFANMYEGIKQDGLGNGEAAADAWTEAVRLLAASTPYYKQVFYRSRLAGSLLAAGRTANALTEIEGLLAVNPRLINVLALKVQAHLDLTENERASTALDQLELALADADADYAMRAQASVFADRIRTPITP